MGLPVPTAALPGFNEAEARAPRMQEAPASSLLGALCFNEAEARAPRMRRRAAARRRSRSRFNEAEARAPRMQGKRKPGFIHFPALQ